MAVAELGMHSLRHLAMADMLQSPATSSYHSSVQMAVQQEQPHSWGHRFRSLEEQLN
jgi:hypothetical protein